MIRKLALLLCVLLLSSCQFPKMEWNNSADTDLAYHQLEIREATSQRLIDMLPLYMKSRTVPKVSWLESDSTPFDTYTIRNASVAPNVHCMLDIRDLINVLEPNKVYVARLRHVDTSDNEGAWSDMVLFRKNK